MNTVSVWRFDTPAGVEVALDAVEQLQARRLVAVDDVAVVAWRPGARRPLAYQVGTAAGNTLSGAFWGLLFGLVFLLPLAGGEDGAGDGAGDAAVLARVGLADGFLARVRARVTPGTSALFLLTDAAAVDRVRAALAGPHTDLLVSTLDREQVAALRRAFDDDDTDTDTDTDEHRG